MANQKTNGENEPMGGNEAAMGNEANTRAASAAGAGTGEGGSSRSAETGNGGRSAEGSSGSNNAGGESTTGGSESLTAGASNLVDKAKETGGQMLDQAKSSMGGMYEAAAGKATSLVDEKRAELSQGLTGAADTVRRITGAITEASESEKVGEFASEYSELAARKLEQAAGYFERTDLKTAARDLEDLARRQPALFIGGAFVLGLLVARFVKSAPANAAAEAPQPQARRRRSNNNATTATASV